MSELSPRTPESAVDEPLLDTFLREAVPEIKLALGDYIDRDNLRAIPDRYARLLPESILVVNLRPDVAEAIRPIARELEEELTDSVLRHGSLYDREYRVKLRVAGAPGAPLFRVSVRKADEPEPEPFPPPPPSPRAEGPATPTPPARPEPALAEAGSATAVAPRPAPAPAAEPAVDPDATRLDGVAPTPRYDGERWALAVEDEEGEEKERFPIPGPMTTVGRQTSNPELRSDVAITDAPHVSRRQLALVWAPRGERPGFTVYNVGLNPLHVGEREVPGANRGKGELKLEDLVLDHTEWVGPGVPMRIGEHGPVLRIVDARGDGGAKEDGAPVDPDATRLG